MLRTLLRRLQQAHGFQQQVVEVQRVGLAQLVSVNLVDVRDVLRLRIARLQVHLLRVEHVVLRPRDARQHVARRELLIVEPEPPDGRLHHLLLIGFVVDDEVLAYIQACRCCIASISRRNTRTQKE